MSGDAFYIVDLRPEWVRGHPYLTFWRPDDAGYCYGLSWAGRYEAERVAAKGDYYTKRRHVLGKGHTGPWERFAVPCSLADEMGAEPDATGRWRLDPSNGLVVRNTKTARDRLRRAMIPTPSRSRNAERGR